MDTNIEVIELIERFHEGKLHGQELDAFLERQQTDQDFAKMVEDYLETFKSIDAVGRQGFMTEVAEWEREIAADEQKPTTSMIPSRRLLAVAASILAVILPLAYLYFSSTNADSQALFASNFQPYENLLASRSDEARVSEDLEVGLGLYEQGDYQKAALRLEAHIGKYPNDLAAKFYLAEALLASDQADDALSFYKLVANDSTSAFQELAEWRIALAYLKLESRDLLGQQLDHIIQAAGHEYLQSARKLQSDLRR